MSLIKKAQDIFAGGTGGFVSLQEIAPIVSENIEPNVEKALINSVLAVVVGLITTGIKDLFGKIFRKKRKKDA